MADFLRYFRPRQDASDAESSILNLANELIDFANTAYYPKFIAGLEAEALKPFKITKDSSDMIESAVRANTLKEIRDTLVRRVTQARAAATQVQEVDDGD